MADNGFPTGFVTNHKEVPRPRHNALTHCSNLHHYHCISSFHNFFRCQICWQLEDTRPYHLSDLSDLSQTYHKHPCIKNGLSISSLAPSCAQIRCTWLLAARGCLNLRRNFAGWPNIPDLGLKIGHRKILWIIQWSSIFPFFSKMFFFGENRHAHACPIFRRTHSIADVAIWKSWTVAKTPHRGATSFEPRRNELSCMIHQYPSSYVDEECQGETRLENVRTSGVLGNVYITYITRIIDGSWQSK